jgi:hypothetical protein
VAEKSSRHPKSAERIKLLDDLCGELATVKFDLEAALSLSESKRKHPDFPVWGLLEKFGYETEVEKADFRPRQLASDLVMRVFGVRPETLRKDRRRGRQI